MGVGPNKKLPEVEPKHCAASENSTLPLISSWPKDKGARGERGGVFYERVLSDKLSGNAAHKIKKSGIPFFEHCSKLVFTRFPFVTKTSIYIEIL